MLIASHLRRGLNQASYDSERTQKLNKEKENPTDTPHPLPPYRNENDLKSKKSKKRAVKLWSMQPEKRASYKQKGAVS